MDIDSYLKRINYDGPKEVSLKSLKDLTFSHITHVPFDNLDMFGGKRKVLDLQVIYNNIVHDHRGGVCYELNGLFYWLLEELGYETTMVYSSGYNEDKDSFNECGDHMLLLVKLAEEDWVVDVGWGGNSLAYPIQLVDLKEQQQANGIYRVRKFIVEGKEEFLLEKRRQNLCDVQGNILNNTTNRPLGKYVKENWKLVFKFDLIPRTLKDFEIGCNRYQDTPGLGSTNSFLVLHSASGKTILHGDKIFLREYKDPLNVIAKETIACSKDNFKELIIAYFDENMKIDFIPNFKKHGFEYP